MVTKKNTGPGRPRSFDPEAALDKGQQLFHARGYDAVGLAALTESLGIKPPSFYKAFGSKAAFFAQVLERYASNTLAQDEILREGRDPLEALSELMESAARIYAKNPDQRGCLVLEATRGSDDAESTIVARRTAEKRRAQIREFIARTHPQSANAAMDYVASTLSGLSASAREGMDEQRLVQIARAAMAGLEKLLNSAS